MSVQHLDKEVVVVTAASIGLVGTVFTRQPFFAPAVYFVFYGFLSLWAKVARIPSESQADHAGIALESIGLVVLSQLVGVFVGTTFVWAVKTPKLIDIDIFYSSRQPYRPSSSWRSVFYPWHLVWFFSIFLAVVGIYCVIDRLDEVPPDIEGLSPSLSGPLGIALIVVGALLALLATVYACGGTTPSGRPGGYTLAYTPVLVVLGGLPYLFYWTREDYSYYSVLFVLGAGVLAYVLFGALALGCGFEIFRTTALSLWRRTEFWLALFFVHLTFITLPLFAGEYYQDSRETTLVLAIVGGVLVLLLVVYGVCFERRRGDADLLPNSVENQAEKDYDTVTAGEPMTGRFIDNISFDLRRRPRR